MYLVNGIYKDKLSTQQVMITGIHMIKPIDIMLSHGEMPVIEYVTMGMPKDITWHMLTTEDFAEKYEKVEK